LHAECRAGARAFGLQLGVRTDPFVKGFVRATFGVPPTHYLCARDHHERFRLFLQGAFDHFLAKEWARFDCRMAVVPEFLEQRAENQKTGPREGPWCYARCCSA
jgi:hypothetical protein